MRKSDFTLLTLDDLFSRRRSGTMPNWSGVRNISTGRAAPVQRSPFKGAEQRGDAADDREHPQGGNHHPGAGKVAAGGGYELISGHRRLAACIRCWASGTMPSSSGSCPTTKAVIAMVDANLQREMSAQRKAFAYKMRD